MHTSPSQSAPTILVLRTWVGLWPWKKSGPKYGPEKSKVKCLFTFWITMILFFALCFFRSIFWTWFLKVPGPKEMSGRPDNNSGCRLTGRLILIWPCSLLSFKISNEKKIKILLSNYWKVYSSTSVNTNLSNLSLLI